MGTQYTMRYIGRMCIGMLLFVRINSDLSQRFQYTGEEAHGR